MTNTGVSHISVISARRIALQLHRHPDGSITLSMSGPGVDATMAGLKEIHLRHARHAFRTLLPRRCEVCGCSDERACLGGCGWLALEVDVCTACAERLLEAYNWKQFEDGPV